ncbi:hypothetical protein DYH09_04330 [bacterium CPR1]|nr:hypothetical protein [bacterium CPR1]
MKFKAIVWLAVFVVACGPGEQVEVQRYLARTDRSVEEFVRLFRQLDDLGGKLREERGGSPMTRARAAALAAWLGPRLKELRTELSAAAEGVRHLTPPGSARRYSEILCQGFEHANRALRSGDELLSELGRGEPSLTNVAGLLGELIRSLEQTGKCAREAELERQRLIDELQLKTGPDGLVLE